MGLETQITQKADAATSYALGSGGILLAIAENINTITLFLGAVLLVIRVAYDGMRFYRRLKDPNDKGE